MLRLLPGLGRRGRGTWVPDRDPARAGDPERPEVARFAGVEPRAAARLTGGRRSGIRWGTTAEMADVGTAES